MRKKMKMLPFLCIHIQCHTLEKIIGQATNKKVVTTKKKEIRQEIYDNKTSRLKKNKFLPFTLLFFSLDQPNLVC